MNLRCKDILFVVKKEYCRWIFNPKMIIYIAILFPIRELIYEPLDMAAGVMNEPIGIFETYIAVANNGVGVLLLALSYMLLMSSFPSMDGNSYYYIPRIGRKAWVIGEIIFQICAGVTYSVITFMLTLIQSATNSFLANGWSMIVTDYDRLYSKNEVAVIGKIIPPNLYFQISPYRAFVLSFILMTLFFIVSGMIFIIGCAYGKRQFFFFANIVYMSMGCGMMLIQNEAMWIFTVCHAFLKLHYQRYFREYCLNPYISLALLCMLIVTCVIILIRSAKNISLDLIGGDVLS